MTKDLMKKMFDDTAYVRTGGSDAEKRAAEYLRQTAADLGLEAYLEPFEVELATVEEATLIIDGREIPCKGYLLAGSGEVEAPLYYLTEGDRYSLSHCKGKIVLFDGYLGYWRYRELLENGAVGFISYDGNVNYADRDIDHRELRPHVAKGEKIIGVNINAKDAVDIVNSEAKTAKIVLKQREYKGNSHNVIIDLPGETAEQIIFTAHYDSTSLSQGAYDNMSGCVGILAMAEYFAKNPHRYSLRFVFCGSEERGLLGSKAYCIQHEAELKDVALVINLDMIGCIMGKFISCVTAEMALVNYISYLGSELGFQVKAYQDVYSSDSTPFADKGVPAISFAHLAPPATATIHNSYDTADIICMETLDKDLQLITAFAERMDQSVFFPVKRDIPENIKDKLDTYLCRKQAK